MKRYRLLILCVMGMAFLHNALAQDDKKALSNISLLSGPKDSTVKKKSSTDSIAPVAKKDSVKFHDPRIATRRSLILPGWGQAYNKEYWKIPVVYGVLAIPVTMFFYNNNYYKKTKFAYEARYKELKGDPSDVPNIDPELSKLGIGDLQNYRNSFRRDRDYSILWFIVAWGVQVADATVFAHLKQFNVSNDLSMQIAPHFDPQTRGAGFSIALNLRNPSLQKSISR